MGLSGFYVSLCHVLLSYHLLFNHTELNKFCKRGYGLLMYPGAYYPQLREIGVQVPFPYPQDILTMVLPSDLESRFGRMPGTQGEERKTKEQRRKRKDEFIVLTVELETPDGVLLRAYLMRRKTYPDRSAKGTIVFFHGNGVIPELMADTYELLLTNLDYWIFSVAYRGYGNSWGSPSEQGLCIDAQTALDYVLSRTDLGELVVVYGHSLGGAVAIDLVSRNPDSVHALILENTFTSIPKLMARFPVLRPFLWTIRQKWESYKKLWNVRKGLPILMLSGKIDNVIPADEMMVLFEIAKKREGYQECQEKGVSIGLGSCLTGYGIDDDDLQGEDQRKTKSSLSLPAAAVGPSPSRSPSNIDKVEMEARKFAMETHEKLQQIAGELEGNTASDEDRRWFGDAWARWMTGRESDDEAAVEIKYFSAGDHMSTFVQREYIPTLTTFFDKVSELQEKVKMTPSSSSILV